MNTNTVKITQDDMSQMKATEHGISQIKATIDGISQIKATEDGISQIKATEDGISQIKETKDGISQNKLNRNDKYKVMTTQEKKFQIRITQDERFMIFMLSYVDSIGCETIKRLDAQLTDLSDLLNISADSMKHELSMRDSQIEGFYAAKRNFSTIAKEYETLLKSKIKFTTFKDTDYPERLKRIKQSPAVLYSYGSLPWDNVPSVGIVGSRACTGYGTKVAEYYGEVLAENGVNIISGMAMGIDAAAHRGALKATKVDRDKVGKTFAVLAGGVNVIYPRENKYIYDELISGQNGGIISEMIPGKAAVSKNFPMRNRIISALSDIVLVVEARAKSGSLITVDYAKAQNVPVMAIPGRITDPLSEGTNKLIIDGFPMAASPMDILEKLSISSCKTPTKNKETLKLLDNNEKIVYSTLVSDPKHIEIIFHETALPREVVMESLISLELKGLASQVSSNYYICK